MENRHGCCDEGLFFQRRRDVDGTKYGHLPKMTVASKGMMGSLMTSSFCERIDSCANLVCTKNNSLLSDDEIDMVVTLRMNRDFMQHMRLYYPGHSH